MCRGYPSLYNVQSIRLHMKNILATTDFTAASRNSVNYAAELAMLTDAKLILLHATYIPVVSDTFFDVTTTLEELEELDRQSMEKENDRLRKKYGEALKLEKKVKIGFAADIIREMVKKGNVSMVVMGMGHMDAFSATVFGSTSTSLAGQLDCPMMIVPEKSKFKPLKKIAFAFDQKTIPTGKGLKELKELTDAFQSTLDFINVQDESYPDHDDKSLRPVLKALAPKASKTHFIVPVHNRTTELLHDWVKRHKANALVTISRDRSIFWLMFNERHTKKLAFETKVPLIVLSERK
jgi:nucleotide-binding universal stress UspA family protein